MPNHKGKSQRSGRSGRSKNNRSRQVNMRPVNMRMIPETWNMAQLDVNPMATPKRDQICTFRRTYTIAQLSANTGDTVQAFNFALSGLPNYTEYTALFDQYRILEVIVSFTPFSTVSATTAVGASYPGLIGSWIDYNDASLPANLQEGQQYDSYQKNICTVPFDRVLHPHSAVASYSGTFSSYDNVYGRWHDCASPSIQHYGCKLVITGSTFATSTKIYDVEATVTLQCRSQR